MLRSTHLIRFVLSLAIGMLSVGCGGAFQSRFGVAVSGDHIVFDEPIRFQPDSADLVEESHAVLDEIVQTLQDNGHITSLRVEGHTDATGDASANQRLSERRAESVVAYLQSNGVSQSLQAAGLGQTQPVCEEDTDDCNTINRRVEFVIVD